MIALEDPEGVFELVFVRANSIRSSFIFVVVADPRASSLPAAFVAGITSEHYDLGGVVSRSKRWNAQSTSPA